MDKELATIMFTTYNELIKLLSTDAQLFESNVQGLENVFSNLPDRTCTVGYGNSLS